jgi:hypothetical protein
MVERAYATRPPGPRAASGDAHATDWVADVGRVLAGTREPVVLLGGDGDGCAAAFLRRLPDARLHACEPRLRPFETLRSTVPSGRAVVDRLALGSSSGLYPGSPANVELPMMTLDAYCAWHGLATIDLLALDADGYELEVLRGAGQLIRTGGLRLLSFVFGESHLASRTFLGDFLELLPDFAFFRDTASGWTPIARDDRAANEVFTAHRIVAAPEANRLEIVTFTRAAHA